MRSFLRTVIVDSDENSRAGIHQMLTGTASVIVGEFTTISDALRTAPAYRPDVVIVEVPLDQVETVNGASSAIQHLSRVLPETAIIVTGPTQSAQLVIQVMRAGALDFVARPIKQNDLREALEKVARSRPTAVPQQQTGRVVVVFSPKGGAGVTTVATDLAVCQARRYAGRGVLVDLDIRQSDVATFLNLRPQYSVHDAFENIGRMDESFLRRLLTEHSSGLFVLPGPAPMSGLKVRADQVRAGLEILRSYFDQVVVDLPHDLDSSTIAALEASDDILLIVRQNVSALRIANAAMPALKKLGIDLNKVKLIVMRERTGEGVSFSAVREMLGLAIHCKLPDDHAAVTAAIDNGEPVVTRAPRSTLSKTLKQLSASIAAQTATEVPQRPRALLARLLANFSSLSEGTK